MSETKLAILAANGGMDSAYKVFNIATAAASMGTEVLIFFTFGGVKLIHKQANATLPLPAEMAGLKGAFAAQNVPTIPELVEMARDLGVTFTACQMTLDLMGIAPDQLVDGVEIAGATSFLAAAYQADTTLTF